MTALPHTSADMGASLTGILPECRFEDRLAGKALALQDPQECITACDPSQLDTAFARIQAAQRQGRWIVLLLDYELGEWLDPALAPEGAATSELANAAQTSDSDAPADAPPAGRAPVSPAQQPRLTAWVFRHAVHETPWTDTAAPDTPPFAQTAHHTGPQPLRLDSRPGIHPDSYRANIESLRDDMARGEFYQANYTFPIHVTAQGDLAQLYRRIATHHPSAHAVWFRDPRRTILSFSPELFVARQGSRLTVRPMKGTAPRDADPAQDQRNADTLRASQKDRAENLMIVDLLRNDLGRSCRIGSVRVPELFTLESYPNVHHLVSCVTGQLADGKDAFDLLAGSFPGGSITGAPKIRAMQIIDELEPTCRSIYCGSLLYVDVRGEMDSSIAIRTLLIQKEQASCWGGGGIVADSDWEAEYQESIDKVSVLLRTLEAL